MRHIVVLLVSSGYHRLNYGANDCLVAALPLRPVIDIPIESNIYITFLMRCAVHSVQALEKQLGVMVSQVRRRGWQFAVLC